MAFEQNQALMQLMQPGYGMQQQQQMPMRYGQGQQQNPLQRQQQQGYGQQGPMMHMQSMPSQKPWWKQILGNIFGEDAQYGYSSDYTPYQRQGFQDIFNQGMNNLQNPYEGFGDIENYAKDFYQNQVVPGVANQFTNMGGGALSSPDFAKQLGAAGTGLASQLAQHRAQYGQQNKQFGLQQAQLGLTPQYQSFQTPATGGLVGGLLQQAGPLAKAGASAYKTFMGGGLL